MSDKRSRKPVPSPVKSAAAQTAFQKVLAHGGREGAVIGLVALTLYLAMALLSFNPVDPGWKSVGHDIDVVTNHAGRSGAFIASLLIALFGHVAYLFPISLGYFAWRVYKADLGTFSGPLFAIRLGGFVLVLLSATSILELYAVFGMDGASGGMLGQGVAGAMKGVFNLPATTLILVSVFLFSVTILTELSWIRLMDRLGSAVVAASQWLVGKAGEVRAAREARALRGEPEPPLVTPVAPSARKPVLADPPVLEDRVDSAAEPEASWLTRFKQQFARRSVESVAETARIEPALDQLDDAPAPRARVRGVERREPVWDESPETLSALDDVPVVGAQGRARAMPVLDEVVNAEPATTPRRAAAPAMSAEPPAKPVRIEPFKRVSVATDMEAATERRMPAVYEDGGGEIPPLTLLDPAEPNQRAGYSRESLEHMSRLLEEKLQDFGVSVEVVEVNPGPVITRFEINPAPGVKVSRISNLAKDLARSLAVISVRVVEVIPGKSVVGIEIPNEHRQIVRLREVLSSPDFSDSGSPLSMALGNDIAGNPVVANLAKMPHVLVAGTTGSGKSVGVNAMLLSMLLKATPEEVRFIMVDPKMLELSIYEGIPHLLTPVVTDMKEAANALRWCVAEMERRYRLMAALGVRNIAGYNRKVKDAELAGEPLLDPLWRPEESVEGEESARPQLGTLPFIVVIIDEFADMMMIVGKKVEELIARIAQKARAAGIHLILATQRPSVDVITGLIKANIPTRMSFQVSSKIDSRTVLDQGGAEQLLGHGDMLYLPPGSGLPIRVHGAFVADDEVHRVVSAWKARGEPDYIEEVLSGGEGEGVPGMGGGGSGGEGDSEGDALYDEAVAFVTQSRRVSISSVQRKFKIGYNRAANLVEAMEASGVVSAAGHNGSREVLAPPPPRD